MHTTGYGCGDSARSPRASGPTPNLSHGTIACGSLADVNPVAARPLAASTAPGAPGQPTSQVLAVVHESAGQDQLKLRQVGGAFLGKNTVCVWERGHSGARQHSLPWSGARGLQKGRHCHAPLGQAARTRSLTCWILLDSQNERGPTSPPVCLNRSLRSS